MARKKKTSPRPSRPRSPPARKGFVGRDASPVLDKYPPKDPKLAPRGPPGGSNAGTLSPPAASSKSSASPTPPSMSPPAAVSLITLEPQFDVDEFASLLGETSVRVTVPIEHLAEVLRRVTEFMGFGIYVYAITVRPAPSEFLKGFIVDLERVDFSPGDRTWVPFVEKGASDSPFGPTGTRT
jgi:hypothetical protein